MKAWLDKRQFGPWALVTGASSGIGREFARQVAAAGINVALAARREALLSEVDYSLSRDFGVQYRVVATDLSEDLFHIGGSPNVRTIWTSALSSPMPAPEIPPSSWS